MAKALAVLIAAMTFVGLTSGGAIAQKPILSGPLVKLDIKPA